MSDTMDLTAVALSLRSTFVRWGAPYLLGELAAIPGLAWLAWPVISALATAALSTVLVALTKTAVMDSLFMALTVQKTGEAEAYSQAVTLKRAVKDNAEPEEYARAENAEMAAFNRLVLVRG